MRSRFSSEERGAAAIEFALVLPILLILILGIFEFGRVFSIQVSLSNAAREGARVMAIQDDQTAARSAAIAAAPGVTPAIGSGQIDISPASCAGVENGTVQVKISYSVDMMTGLFGASLPLEGRGVMVCGG